MLYFDARPTFGQDLTAIMQRAAFADNVLMTIAEEMEARGGFLSFPDVDPKNPEGSQANEWFEIERTFFINERAAILAAIRATNPGLKSGDLQRLLQSKNAFPELPMESTAGAGGALRDPILASFFAERIENMLKFYDEHALKTKPRGKTGLPFIIGGVAVGLLLLGALTYFTRKK